MQRGATSQFEYKAILCNGTIAVGFASLWLRNWWKISQSEVKRNARIAAFDTHLKTAAVNHQGTLSFCLPLHVYKLEIGKGCSLPSDHSSIY